MIEALRISLGQLMSFTWRTIVCLDAIEVKHHLKMNVKVIKASYILKKDNGCHYRFTNMNKDEAVILNINGVNDRGWK